MNIRITRIHRYLRIKGIYAFVGKNALKVIIGLSAIVALILLAQKHIPDFNGIITNFLGSLSTPILIIIFYVSESILGLIPPDFFIVWSKTTSHPFLALTFLACLSYLGGMTAYFIGKTLAKFPKVNRWLKVKLSKHFATLNRYGGFLVVFAALFPLPFSTVTLVTGMINYPFKRVALLGLTRFLRFYIYASVLFHLF